MEIRNLVTFLKVTELNCFSKAAEALDYSQSAVTVQIQQLERELGVRLFDRIGKNVSITQYGKNFISYARDIVSAVARAQVFASEETELTGMVQVGTLAVSGGVLSMLTLILKGVFCLLASFLLMATTTIEAICRALRQLHVPKLLTNLLLLTFRYVGLLLSEVAVMQQAYSLRAPGQKGIHISAWGSFLGQLLLRSMDRAQALYESMELRGFSGEFPGAVRGRGSAASWPYALVCPALMLLARYFDLSALMGGLFV